MMIKGLTKVQLVVRQLIDGSISFHVEPYPDDSWKLTVEKDRLWRLEAIIVGVEAGMRASGG